jgi:hypothetical protein
VIEIRLSVFDTVPSSLTSSSLDQLVASASTASSSSCRPAGIIKAQSSPHPFHSFEFVYITHHIKQE